MGAIGLMGAMACLIVLIFFSPPPTQLAGYALMRGAMASIATWVFFPSLGLTLVAGLLAIAVNRAFHNAGWAWVKLATGILMFEGGLVYIQGPMQDEAALSASARRARFAVGIARGCDVQCGIRHLAAEAHQAPGLVDQPATAAISATIRSAVARRSGALVIGRPMTR
jgi:hypothetical protein